MMCCDTNRHQKSMEGILKVGSGGQCPPGGWPHNPATWFHPSTTTVVSSEPFPHCERQKDLAPYRHWSVPMWRAYDPNHVPHRRILPSYRAERWSVPASLCWWCCYCPADQLWKHVCLGIIRLWRFVTNLLYRSLRNTLYNNNNYNNNNKIIIMIKTSLYFS